MKGQRFGVVYFLLYIVLVLQIMINTGNADMIGECVVACTKTCASAPDVQACNASCPKPCADAADSPKPGPSTDHEVAI
ncbi:hypothetical protein CASFOL_024834 [Castilleja foliolosa]|uniref:Uncharacterized protein n=1 Tax=Castilleja foliolosa TaxID=1961234 RepID=A0ABD3CPH6_9LAMI